MENKIKSSSENILEKNKIFNFSNPETKEIYSNYFMFGYFKDNLGYILNDTVNKTLIGIDFGEFSKTKEVVDILEEFTKSKLKYILTTHSHWDHSGGNKKWKDLKKDDLKIIGGDTPEDLISNAEIFLKDNEEIKFGNILIKCLFTPGHIKSHVSYFVSDSEIKNQNFVFTGDTLFSAGCGRVFTGTHNELFNSLNRLKELPLNTMIYCGHEYTLQNLKFSLSLEPDNVNVLNKIEAVKKINEENKFSMGSTIKEELLYNPFLRCDLGYYADKFGVSNPDEIFKILRDMKDKF